MPEFSIRTFLLTPYSAANGQEKVWRTSGATPRQLRSFQDRLPHPHPERTLAPATALMGWAAQDLPTRSRAPLPAAARSQFKLQAVHVAMHKKPTVKPTHATKSQILAAHAEISTNAP